MDTDTRLGLLRGAALLLRDGSHPRVGWQADGACVGDLTMLDERTADPATCQRCPVAVACLADALADGAVGVRAGTDAATRACWRDALVGVGVLHEGAVRRTRPTDAQLCAATSRAVAGWPAPDDAVASALPDDQLDAVVAGTGRWVRIAARVAAADAPDAAEVDSDRGVVQLLCRSRADGTVDVLARLEAA